MPGPLNGTHWGLSNAARMGLKAAKEAGYVVTSHRAFPDYVSRHGKCMNGPNCTGAGCRVNRG